MMPSACLDSLHLYDRVDLRAGSLRHAAPRDIAATLPNGGIVSFARTWSSLLAVQGYGSPGLAKGWTHNWDLTLRPAAADDTWGPLDLIQSDEALVTFRPVLDEHGLPIGAFEADDRFPYYLTGLPSPIEGCWEQLTLTRIGEPELVFGRQDGVGPYVIVVQRHRLGDEFTPRWDSRGRLLGINHASTGAPLLTATYDGNGWLTEWTNHLGEKVTYTQQPLVGDGFGGHCVGLLSVSTVTRADDAQPSARWHYEYGEAPSIPATQLGPAPRPGQEQDPSLLLLTSVIPSGDRGAGIPELSAAYHQGSYRVALVDGAGRARCAYTYEPAGPQILATGFPEREDYLGLTIGSAAVMREGRCCPGDLGFSAHGQEPVAFTFDARGNLLTCSAAADAGSAPRTCGRVSPIGYGLDTMEPMVRTSTAYMYDAPPHGLHR